MTDPAQIAARLSNRLLLRIVNEGSDDQAFYAECPECSEVLAQVSLSIKLTPSVKQSFEKRLTKVDLKCAGCQKTYKGFCRA